MIETDKREINKNHVAALLRLFPSAEVLYRLRTKRDASSLCQFWKELKTGAYLEVGTSCVPHLLVCLGEKYRIYLWASFTNSSKSILQEMAPQVQSVEGEGGQLYWFLF